MPEEGGAAEGCHPSHGCRFSSYLRGVPHLWPRCYRSQPRAHFCIRALAQARPMAPLRQFIHLTVPTYGSATPTAPFQHAQPRTAKPE
eukprot:scaffold1306_cov399-Prasinococcus_capsulatus_cf.AAC.13